MAEIVVGHGRVVRRSRDRHLHHAAHVARGAQENDCVVPAQVFFIKIRSVFGGIHGNAVVVTQLAQGRRRHRNTVMAKTFCF